MHNFVPLYFALCQVPKHIKIPQIASNSNLPGIRCQYYCRHCTVLKKSKSEPSVHVLAYNIAWNVALFCVEWTLSLFCLKCGLLWPPLHTKKIPHKLCIQIKIPIFKFWNAVSNKVSLGEHIFIKLLHSQFCLPYFSKILRSVSKLQVEIIE